MAARYSLRNRRRKSRIPQIFQLQLTSMLDVTVILVVFLLKSIATTQATIDAVPGMELPVSRSKNIPTDSPKLIVTESGMTFEGQKILEFNVSATQADSANAYNFKNTDLDEGGNRIVPLYSALMDSKEKSELLRLKSSARDAKGNPLPFEGVIAIQADKHLQYDILRKVMYTAGTAGFKVFRFLAMKKE